MRAGAWVGWLIGVVTAAVAVGVGELAAAFVRPAAAPVIAVGNRLITLTPSGLRRSAIESTGTNDKPLLILGIYVLLALFGALIGSLALHRVIFGLAGVALLAAFGAYCAATADAGRPSDVVPTLVGAAAAAVVLVALVHLARQYQNAPLDNEGHGPDAAAPQAGADRRRFLFGAAGAAAVAAVAGFGGRATQSARYGVSAQRAALTLPGGGTAPVPRGADLGKSGVPWRTPNALFYRIDRALEVPQIAPTDWTLTIDGLVEHPLTLNYHELLSRELVDRWITLCCVSNPVGGELVSNALFRGVRLADVLREAGLSDSADELLMTGADGTTIGAPAKVVTDGREALLAVAMNGVPLPLEHGFPVRVVVPGLYGYVSACKWVQHIEATTFAARRAFWVENGWAPHPELRLESRIDRPSSGELLPVGRTVAVAGVAWDQHVGVSRVEVQVDYGPWQPARLAAVPSADTWRQWVLPWAPPRAGSYVLRVRAVDARGRVQDPTVRPVFPSGASGYHAVTVRAGT
ncbi:MAG TPA: molybdopterin-dependent oxidoreductase [Jatrophihabitans sp.]|nr:molybdopterin-dependent oxidoreductase [Jatrophihabitans sp.]